MTDHPSVPFGRPPGWYVHPNDQSLVRWWDGNCWTDAMRPMAPRQSMQGSDWPPSPGNNRNEWRMPPSTGERSGSPSRQPRYVSGNLTDPFVENRSLPSQNEQVPIKFARNSSLVSQSLNDRARVASTAIFSDERSQKNNIASLGLSALFAFSLVLFAAGYGMDAAALRIIGLAGILFFGVGTAPLQLSDQASLSARLGVACVIGLSVPLAVASIMVLTPLWHPVLAGLIIGLFTVILHIAAFRRAFARLPNGAIVNLFGHRARIAFDFSIAFSLGGTVLWCVAALNTGHVIPGMLGFLPKISILWYIGILFLLSGIILARGKSELHVIFGVVSLLAALTLTPSILYGMPKTQTAGKHIDLVQLVLQTHHLNRTAGIYQAYSGFFSGVAWFSKLAGIHDTTGIATYWPFFIDLVVLVGLYFFLGCLTPSRYRIWAVITLALLANSIGADYFSPQSVGFALGVALFGIALNNERLGLDDRTRVIILAFAGCSMAATHELSPYIVGGVLAILVIFGIARPWYLPATILVPAILWAEINRQVVSENFSFAHLFEFSNFAPPQTTATAGLQRLPIVGESSDALALALVILITLAAVGFFRTIKDRSTWAFMLSAGIGLILVVVNPYGNEGIFRAALFSIPWIAAVAMRALPEHPPRWISGVYGCVAVGLTATYLISIFGLDNADVMRPADFQALRIYQATASTNSYILTLSYGPVPLSLTFPSAASHFVLWQNLITAAQAKVNESKPGAAEALARQYQEYAQKNGDSASDLYAVWSPASAAYAVDYGLETLRQAYAWRNLIIASPNWRVVYSSDGTYLFRVVMSSHVSQSQSR